MKLFELLQVEKGALSIIGSGGKTTMMLTLARELSQLGKVIVTTTTHIMPPSELPLIQNPREFSEPCVCMGKFNEQGKLGIPCPMEELLPLADWMLIEADGSKRLPIKAHLSYEPVVPDCSKKTVLVVGASGFGKPIGQIAHRAEQYCWLSNSKPTDSVTPDNLAAVFNKEGLADCVFVNQVETAAQREQVYRLKELIFTPVFMGELQKEVWTCV
ncbi:MAG: selenium cofactor biosynthesis protein YqeC [Eubacteriales bacterium]|nr:selenium cofactor biosynthesis protein YqeC [Eubacteriales bacterium]